MKSLRKKIEIIALIVDVVLSANGCVVGVTDVDDHERPEAQRVEVSASYTKVIPVGEASRLSLTAINGKVLLRGVEGAQEVRIEAERRVRGYSLADAEEHLRLLEILAVEVPGGVEVKTRQPSSTGGRGYEVEYDLTVPAAFRVEVIQGNGEVALADFRGDVVVESGNGNVALSGHRGGARVSAGNGEVRSDVVLPPGGKVVHAVGNGGIRLTIQPEVSATFGARAGNGYVSVSGLSFTRWIATSRTAEGILGTGNGVVDLAVGNGWIQVRGG